MTTHDPARPCSSPARPPARDDQQNGARPSSPSPSGDEHRMESPEPHHPNPSSSSQGRAPWHYPNPLHPATEASPLSSWIRTHPYPTCHAPSSAQCITRTGKLYDGNHKARARAWGAAR